MHRPRLATTQPNGGRTLGVNGHELIEQEHGATSTETPTEGQRRGTIEIPGTLTPPMSLPISGKGFGTKVPERPVHSQLGDLRKKRVIRLILEDEQYRCYLTGVKLTPETAELDHVIPISQGGHPTDARNGGFLHSIVNRMKGVLTLDEFMHWCKAVSSSTR